MNDSRRLVSGAGFACRLCGKQYWKSKVQMFWVTYLSASRSWVRVGPDGLGAVTQKHERQTWCDLCAELVPEWEGGVL